jgi:hypothetical protein
MKRFIFVAALIASVTLAAGETPVAVGQIPDLPRIPKVHRHRDRDRDKDKGDARDSDKSEDDERPKADDSKPDKPRAIKDLGLPVEDPSATSGTPSVAKDTLQLTAFTFSAYKGNSDVWSWVPRIKYSVNGPIESGSVLSVEFTLPTGPWVKFDCKTSETKKGDWHTAECGARDLPEDMGTTYTGPVDFTIHLRNELSGGDVELYKGKFTVSKVHSNENPESEKYKEHYVYYIEQDWQLPIGYVYFKADGVRGWKIPEFHAAFWVRGDPNEMEPHLFYKGKEVGKVYLDGNEIGKATASSDLDLLTTHTTDDSLPQHAKWSRVQMDFPGVKAWNTSGEKQPEMSGRTGSIHMLNENPGEYELKVLWKGKLARSMKFTVGPDGKIDNTIAIASKLGNNRAIVPVKIIGEQDGKWDKDAWKTDAFYGNPLTGFTPAQ